MEVNSKRDRLFSIPILEFSDRVAMPCTHGKTCEGALRNGEEVRQMYLNAWANEGEPIP